MKPHICCIYTLFDRNGDVDYVGRTKKERVHFRMMEHKAVLGFYPAYKVIDECKTDCRNVEKKWIAHYRELGCKLRNINYGQGPHFLPESAIQKLRDKMTGRPVTWGSKISLAQTGQPRNWSPEGLERIEKTWFKKGNNRWDIYKTDEELATAKEKQKEYGRMTWEGTTPEERSRIGRERQAKRDPEEVKENSRKRVEKLRANGVLHEVAVKGGVACAQQHPDLMSKTIGSWWEELRKDPVKYREYIDNRTQRILEAKAKKKQERLNALTPTSNPNSAL